MYCTSLAFALPKLIHVVLVSNLRPVVSVLPPGSADRQDISIFWHDSIRFWQPRSYLNLNFAEPQRQAGIPTSLRISITQFLSFQQHLALQSTRVVACVTLCPGGATPFSRLEFTLRFVETYLTSGLSLKRSNICARLQAVTFQMVLIPYALSQWLRIWHVLHL